MQQPVTEPNMQLDNNQEQIQEEPIEESKPKKNIFPNT